MKLIVQFLAVQFLLVVFVLELLEVHFFELLVLIKLFIDFDIKAIEFLHLWTYKIAPEKIQLFNKHDQFIKLLFFLMLLMLNYVQILAQFIIICN